MLRVVTALRRAPLDVRGFVVIALAIIATHIPFSHFSLCFNDPAWMFHFGRRTLHGAVPYRDYVWQVGPLPVYMDAAFQSIFGEHYRASLYAGMFVTILRVFTVWTISRRLAGLGAASAFAAFCAVDPLFSFAHHWSTPYAELCFTLSGLCFVLAVNANGSRQLVCLVLAGATAALVVTSRQSSAVTIGLLLALCTTGMLLRGEFFTRARFAALWGGFVGALALFALVLAALGVLGDAVQQLFLDGPQKKGIHGIDAVLDAISGGALVDGRYTRFTGFLFFLALPCALTAGIFVFGRQSREWGSRELSALAIPSAVVLGLVIRDCSLDVLSDLPRTFFTATTFIAVVFPDRMRTWFGVEPLVAVGLTALPLASDWALEMSFPGRGWGDATALVTAVVLFGLASSAISRSSKLVVCMGLAAAAAIHLTLALAQDYAPFAKAEATDATMSDSSFSPHIRAARTPIARGIRMPEWRAKAIEWLGNQVEPGSTCFVYANLPLLYDLLDCKNPTRVDDTITDFPSLRDVREALAVMRAHPPDYILAHDRMWMSPAISLDLGGDINRYDSWNRQASFELHMGLRELIGQYDSVGVVGDFLGPKLAEQAKNHWDAIDAIHVYRRKR